LGGLPGGDGRRGASAAEGQGFPFQKSEKWLVGQRFFWIPIFPGPARFFLPAAAIFLDPLSFFYPGFSLFSGFPPKTARSP
jgi:hypothetical protein